jgi:hypothetical protein
MKFWSKNSYIYRALPAEVILLSSSSFRRGFRRAEKMHRMLKLIKWYATREYHVYNTYRAHF